MFDNQIKTLPNGLFDPLASIQTVHLGRNPLVCDCKLKWLNEFLKTKPVERSGITCSTPKRLAKKNIGSMPNSKFRCNSNLTDLPEEFCGPVSECPKDCVCQGSVIDCRGQNFNDIPENIPEYATEL